MRSLFRRNVAVPASPAAGEAYCCDDLVAFPLADQTTVVHSRTHRSVHRLPATTADLLARCAGFATLEDHARARGRELGLDAEAVASLVRELRDLARAGLLVSRSSLGESAKRWQTPPVPIRSLGVITCDRPDGLQRALDGYVANARGHDRTPDYVVVDDAVEAGSRAHAREVARAVARGRSVAIRYAGLEEKRRFAEALAAAAGADPETVRFGLLDTEGGGHSTGANRNALLLDTVGDMVLSVDDDTMCRLAPAPDARDGLAFVSTYDPTELAVFPDREAALASVAFADADALALHEQILGQSPASCLARLGSGDDAVSPRFLSPLIRGSGTVLISHHGLVGDSGMGSPHYYLSLERPSRLTASADDYRRLRQSREVVRAVSRLTVSEGNFCMTPFLGLDNRGLLPPFFPVQRNSDGIFGAVLRKCFPHGYAGFLPSLLVHAPLAPRAFGREAIRGSGRLALADIVMSAVSTFEPAPGTLPGAPQLQRLGEHLALLGTRPWADFAELVRLDRCRRASRWTAILERRLQSLPRGPDAWKEDIEIAIERLGSALVADDHVIALDLAESGGQRRDRDATAALTRRLVAGYGRLLQAWPDLVEAARSLRSRGERVSQPA